MTTPAAEHVVITGCGWVTPFGIGSIPEVLAASDNVTPPPEPEGGYWAVPEEFLGREPSLSAELKADRSAWIAALAFEQARGQAGSADAVPAERVGMVLGCALAGQLGMIAFANEVRQQSPRFVSPIHFPQTVGNYVAGALARAYNIRGPNSTIAAGMASGLDAVAQGCALLESGVADLVYAGGFEALSPELALGLSRPGVVLSEGACLFVLERAAAAGARGVAELARIVSYIRHAPGEPLSSAEPAMTTASAGVECPGAVEVERRFGRCFAALGAAALATGLASVSHPSGPPLARALADADGAYTSAVEVSGGA